MVVADIMKELSGVIFHGELYGGMSGNGNFFGGCPDMFFSGWGLENFPGVIFAGKNYGD